MAFVFTWALAAPAAAEPGVCDWTAASVRQCDVPRACDVRRDCLGLGADDYVCEALRPPTDGVTCVPDCTTMFTCDGPADCPTIHGIAPTCDPVEPPTTGGAPVPNACTYRVSDTAAVPLAAQIRYCTASGLHIPNRTFRACHTLPGTTTFTTDYYAGDCDGDLCPNGADTDPCSRQPGACMAVTTFDSPFCAPLSALACDLSSGALDCGEARPCSTEPMTPTCDLGACDTSWSDGPRCRPTCSTLFLCSTATAPAGAPTETCPSFGGEMGTCAALPAAFGSIGGRDGLCLYRSMIDASCMAAPGRLDVGCFTTPGGVLTSNFFEGDCDGDGAPNGCDTMRCADGGGTSACVTPPGGDACAPSYVPPVDAGVGDAGTDDAGADDAGTGEVDAGDVDAGDVGGDASSGIDGGLGSSFSGGGGCRCAAAGVGARPWAGAALAMLVLGLVMRRRARRC